MSASLRLGCFSGATPASVEVTVTAVLRRTGRPAGDRVTDGTSALSTPLPAATTDPATGVVTQPDLQGDPQLLAGSPTGHDAKLRAVTDLDHVLFGQAAASPGAQSTTLHLTYCTAAAYPYTNAASHGTLTSRFFWPGADGVDSKLVVHRDGANGPTAVYSDSSGNDTEETPTVDGACTAVALPTDLLPATVRTLKITTTSTAKHRATYDDRAPQTTLTLDR
ncbi:MAG: hypothetical protein ACXVW9_00615 [Nocardioidaceae bacterium]